MKENGTTVHEFSAALINLASQMVNQEIAVDRSCKRDQRRDHLHTGADGIDHVRTRIKFTFGLEDVIGHNGEALVSDIGSYVGAEHEGAGRSDHPCGLGIIPDAHFHGPPVMIDNILPNTSFNTFIPTHYPEIRY